ncbi:DUF2474 domain-containing protein [Oceanicola sp. D3]|nr:DUF2474 domain-containing protein [Oceanicola sp. D3]QDC11132.1 DUF2474 domain-containing protein [Oceanicola sp. D3]
MRRVAWFIALYGGSLLVLGLVALAIRAALGL